MTDDKQKLGQRVISLERRYKEEALARAQRLKSDMNDDEKAAEEYVQGLIQAAKDASLRGESWALAPAQSKCDFLAGIAHEREKSRWVSVSEGLPEDNQLVLVNLTHAAPFVAYWRSATKQFQPESEFVGGLDYHIDEYPIAPDREFDCYVSHWMPLPDAPNAGKKEGESK